jgi:hypothetical protein
MGSQVPPGLEESYDNRATALAKISGAFQSKIELEDEISADEIEETINRIISEELDESHQGIFMLDQQQQYD